MRFWTGDLYERADATTGIQSGAGDPGAKSSSASHVTGPDGSEGPTDEIPSLWVSQEVLEVGSTRVGAINGLGDADGYRVELVAGQSYVFQMSGAGATPLEDPYLELYYPDGTRAAIDDDGGPGRDSQLRFTASVSGTYTLNVRAWEDNGVPTLTGGYAVSAAHGPPQNPLDALDLGFILPTTNVSVYFAGASEVFDGVTAQRNWSEAEIAAAMSAMATFSAVTTLTFNRVASAAGATFVMTLADLPGSVIGQFSTVSGTGYGVFDPSPSFWSLQMLQPGGLAYATILHEVGHGLGLAHPHDNGGVDPNDSSEIMQGVFGEFNTYGTFGFNQGVYTIMSYNRGAPNVPFGESGSNIFGGESTPGPLDIALLQQKYGVNASTNAGDNVYVLIEGNGPGTRYQTIWDVGGSDSIVYNGALSVVIDMRAATLLTAPLGAGGLSYIDGVYGGFTVANGVFLETASSGSGHDQLFGGLGSNTLLSGAGNDTLSGGGGDDTLDGGDGDDRVSFEDNLAGVTVNLLTQSAIDGWGDKDTLISIEHVTGSAYNDIIIGGPGGSSGRGDLVGGAGNDYLEDHSINGAWLHGGVGDDTLVGAGGGIGAFYGGVGNDILVGSVFDDLDLWGEDGNDHVDGGNGNDGIFGGAGDDVLNGGAGDDVIDGLENADTISGGDGNDQLTGWSGNDTVNGGTGDDLLLGGFGDDVVDGGAGSDTASYYAELFSNVTVSLAIAGVQDTGNSGFDTLIGIENLIGSIGSDSLTGDAAANRLDGSQGDDVLNGGAGDDTLQGGFGDDIINGGAGDDFMAGSDHIFYTGDDIFDGGEGNDTVALQWMEGAIVSLAIAGAQDDSYSGTMVFRNVENLIGSQFNDLLVGDGAANRLAGGKGEDQLDGGAGNDTLIGGLGADTLAGSSGTDTADYGVSSASVTVKLWNGTGVGGDAQGDVLSGIENITGSGIGDTLVGSLVVGNVLDGGGGSDYLVGLSGDDLLIGGAGNDLMEGGDDNDILRGGIGADTMAGGAGLDTADYSASGSGVTVHLAGGAATGVGGEAQGDVLSGVENLSGSAFGDTLRGDAGASVLIGNAGDDALDGSAGDDLLRGGAGADTLIGGLGVDTADYSSATTSVTVKLWNGTGVGGDAQGDVLSGIENIRGSSVGDTLVGSLVVGNVLDGGGGSDYIAGLSGDDLLIGGVGNDILDGGEDNDTLQGGVGADTLTGGAGADMLDYTGSTASVTVKLWNNTAVGGDAQGDVISGFENIRGGAVGDTLVGSLVVGNLLDGGGGGDYLAGLSGDDTLFGGDGNDILDGGEDKDTLRGGVGADTLIGGAGVDTLDYTGSAASMTIKLWNNTTTGGDAQGDVITGFENVRGGSIGDTLVGSLVVGNVLEGGGGGDYLAGLSGNDTLIGGAGNDLLDGGEDNDLILQGSTDGRDIIDGGAGHDTWRLTGTAAAETFRIYTRAEALAAGMTGLGANTEIVITKDGTNNASIIAELDNIEEIEINALLATANNGNGTVDGGSAGGDTILVIGDFTTTSLDYSTIRIAGSSGDDTIDISGLSSAHRVVFTSNGGEDAIIGTPRPQDVFEGLFQDSELDLLLAAQPVLHEAYRTMVDTPESLVPLQGADFLPAFLELGSFGFDMGVQADLAGFHDRWLTLSDVASITG